MTLKHLRVAAFLLLLPFFPSIQLNAIQITRYVCEGASGDGLTKENPTGDLQKVLDLSAKVDATTIYLAPGTYHLRSLDDINNRSQYSNITIYGGGLESVAPAENKSVITGDLKINGGLVCNVDFRGSKTGNKVEGFLIGSLNAIGCNLYYCDATCIEVEAPMGATTYLYEVNSNSTLITSCRSNSYGDPVVQAKYCNFTDGDGASIGGVLLKADYCSFSNNSEIGLGISPCEGSVIKNSKFVNNKGKGAVEVSGLSDDILIYFDRCIFAYNSSDSNEHSAVLTSRSPVWMQDCLIAWNSSSMPISNYKQPQGAVEIARRQSRFINCTFFDNKVAAIYYNMAPGDQQRISSPQLVNCVILKNGQPFVSYYGNEPVFGSCATDFGSEIPELDAERGIIRITEQNAGISLDRSLNLSIASDSPLINAGKLSWANDINNVSHLMLGATDIGCVEYCGDWSVSPDKKAVILSNDSYIEASTSFKGKTYKALVREHFTEGEKVKTLKGSIYLGDCLAPIKILDDNNLIVYSTVGNSKQAILYTLQSDWTAIETMEFTNSLPGASQDGKSWKLKKTVAGSTKASSRASSSKRR